jgi:outer membrane immunogenic protein
MKRFTIAALAVALMSSGAYAADVYGKGESLKDGPSGYQATTNWSGLWLGVVGGAAFGSNELNFNAHETKGSTPDSINANIDGLSDQSLFGEAQLGFDYQLGNVVIGLFGGINAGNGEFKASASFDDGDKIADDLSGELTFSQKWGAVVGPRVGFARGKSLIYFAGGVAFGEMEEVDGSVTKGTKTESGKVFPEQETDLLGWFGEIGVEHKLSENIAFKLAGRYTDFGSIDLSKGLDRDVSHSLTLDRDVLAVMGGITFRTNIVRPNLD